MSEQDASEKGGVWLEVRSIAFEPKQFTLQEANLVLPQVIKITEEAAKALEAVNEPFSRLGLRRWSPVTGFVHEDLVKAVWVERIATLGAYPKGFFDVDFESPDGETFYCWSYGEDMVCHEHKRWESFDDRRPLPPERDN
jgi:hypothetical protein